MIYLNNYKIAMHNKTKIILGNKGVVTQILLGTMNSSCSAKAPTKFGKILQL